MAPKPQTETPTTGAVLSDVRVVRESRDILSISHLKLAEHRIGVVGRNGSGKSTFARVLCGLIAPEAGTGHVGGTDMIRDRKRAITEIGILFQNPDHQIIFPTVAEEIGFGLTQLGHRKADARAGAQKVLERFGKRHWEDRAIHTLSQGQRHLVCLMAVLVMSPKMIVLDEPFAGLDIPTTAALNRYLADLDQQIVHITHDPATLADYDRVLWLEGGLIQMDGPAETVLPAFTQRMEAIDDLSDLTD